MACLSVSEKLVAVTTKENSIILRLPDLVLTENEIEPGFPRRFDTSRDFAFDVVSSAISPCGKWFAYCLNNKHLSLWDIDKWCLISTRSIPRGGSKVLFTPNSESIIVADKAGEVHSYSVVHPDEPGKFLLGHISVLLDMIITPDLKFIITCDRDEKIRVSHYPNTYNIQCFCLGHEEFVTSVNVFNALNKLIVSSSGDGTLHCWNYITGKEIGVYHCSKDIEPQTNETRVPLTSVKVCKLNQQTQLLCVSVYKHNGILVYHADNKFNVSIKQRISLPAPALSMYLSESKNLWILSCDGLEFKSWGSAGQPFSPVVPDSTQKILKLMNAKVSTLSKALQEGSEIIPVLYKRKFDEIQEYQQRKQARLAKDSDDKNNIELKEEDDESAMTS